LGAYWRSDKRDEDEIERLWRAHKEAVEAFVVAAGEASGRAAADCSSAGGRQDS
jgi:hypothetical protein